MIHPASVEAMESTELKNHSRENGVSPSLAFSRSTAENT